MSEKLLNTKEIRERLGIGKTKLYELINLDYIPTIKMGNRYYVSETNLNRFIKNGVGKQY